MNAKPRLKPIETFTLHHLGYLDAQAQCLQPLPECCDPSFLIQAYQFMVLSRLLDDKAIKMQRVGQLGTYPANTGQEAIGCGLAMALTPDDVYCPYYRETSALIARGVPMEHLLQVWAGDERGNGAAALGHDHPLCVPIATQCLHAAGCAFALKQQDKQAIALCCIGEGGTSKGDFYEALNFAACQKLPLVLLVNNNQWAISVPRSEQTAAESFAQKGIAFGVPGIQVDGNDVIAVHQAVLLAKQHALSGKGPTLIEAVTYRLCDHTTADDASRYSDADQLKQAWDNEPLIRLNRYLTEQGHWCAQRENELRSECQQNIQATIQRLNSIMPAQAQEAFDHLYHQLPHAYLDQYQQLSESS